MPNNIPYEYSGNLYNQNSYNPYLSLQNKIIELEKRIKILENKLSSLNSNYNGDNKSEYEYQTSMHMM